MLKRKSHTFFCVRKVGITDRRRWRKNSQFRFIFYLIWFHPKFNGNIPHCVVACDRRRMATCCDVVKCGSVRAPNCWLLPPPPPPCRLSSLSQVTRGATKRPAAVIVRGGVSDRSTLTSHGQTFHLSAPRLKIISEYLESRWDISTNTPAVNMQLVGQYAILIS